MTKLMAFFQAGVHAHCIAINKIYSKRFWRKEFKI